MKVPVTPARCSISAANLMLTLLFACGGCGTRALGPSTTSGEVGCPRQEITITDDDEGWSTRSWTAHCKGKTFYCSSRYRGPGDSDVSCEPAVEDSTDTASAGSAAAPGGCQYDTQCKGDRICVDGGCVERD